MIARADAAGDRRDVHEVAAAALEHARQQRAREAQSRVQVRLQDRRRLLGVGLDDEDVLLVTEDRRLRAACLRHGVTVMSVDELLELLPGSR